MMTLLADGVSRVSWSGPSKAAAARAVLERFVGRQVTVTRRGAPRAVTGVLVEVRPRGFVIGGRQAVIRYAELQGSSVRVVG